MEIGVMVFRLIVLNNTTDTTTQTLIKLVKTNGYIYCLNMITYSR